MFLNTKYHWYVLIWSQLKRYTHSLVLSICTNCSTSCDGPLRCPMHTYNVCLLYQVSFDIYTSWDSSFGFIIEPSLYISLNTKYSCIWILTVISLSLEIMFGVWVTLPGPLLIISTIKNCSCFPYSLINISGTLCEGS